MGTVKLSANLPQGVVEALRGIAARQGISMTEAIRRAVSHSHYFTTKQHEGNRVLLAHPDGSMREVLL